MSLKQQSLLIIGIAFALFGLTWCSVTANAAPQPTLISGVMMAEASPKDVDPLFLRDWIIVALIALGVVDKIIGWKRKPSVDVDFTTLRGRMDLAENEIKQVRTETRLIFATLRELQDTLSRLATGQATNTANITDIKDTCHSLRDEVTRNDQQVTQQLSAINQRIDGLHAHPRPR